jgi:hypothetical protein
MSICTMTLETVCKIYLEDVDIWMEIPIQICDKKIMTWNFPYRPWYQPSTHISPLALLSGLIWESRANTKADMENVM